MNRWGVGYVLPGDDMMPGDENEPAEPIHKQQEADRG